MLKPGGRLGLVWNVRDEDADWVRELSAILSPHEGNAPRFYRQEWRQVFVDNTLFGPLHEQVFRHEHRGPPEQLIMDRIMSVSFIASLPDAPRGAVHQQLHTLIATHPGLQGQAEIAFPYLTRAFACQRRS